MRFVRAASEKRAKSSDHPPIGEVKFSKIPDSSPKVMTKSQAGLNKRQTAHTHSDFSPLAERRRAAKACVFVRGTPIAQAKNHSPRRHGEHGEIHLDLALMTTRI